MFTLKFGEGEGMFSMVVNVIHESKFSHFWVMMVQEKDLSLSLW